MGLDYYGLLGITRQASINDIQRAYRKLSVKYHPDRCSDFKAQRTFYNLAEAYDVLSHSRTKCLYDQYGEEGIKSGVFLSPGRLENEGPVEVYAFHGDPFKVFREFFGVDNPFAELKLPNIDPEYKFVPIPEEEKVQGENIRMTFPLEFREAYQGCTKTLTIKQILLDDDKLKTIERDRVYKFKVPRGCVDGKTFIFKSYGNEGRNIIPGDVIFIAELQEDAVFKLEDKNLVIEKRIPLAHALTGCVVNVETIEGKIMHIPMTGVIKPKQRFVIKGEGMTIEDSTEKGNLLVELDIDFPERLSECQKRLVRTALLKN